MQEGFGYQTDAVANDSVEARARFITRTYNHLFGAILAFAAIEVVLFETGLAYSIARALTGVSWMLVLGAFMISSWVASRAAHTARTLTAQYLGLAGYVVAQAIIFVPLLVLANTIAPGVIASAGIVTMVGFSGLSAIAFYTRKDFSFLRGILMWGGIGALLLVFVSAFFGITLGVFFSVAMVVFAGAAILYDTSNIIHHFPEDRYVGAALELFASVALMFWYVLRLFLAARR